MSQHLLSAAARFMGQVSLVVRNELRFQFRTPRFLGNSLILLLVPALYSLLYISSVWSPETRTQSLSVAIVNLDQGVNFHEHNFNVGWEITTRLQDSGRFDFKIQKDVDQAKQLVRQGKLAFAVIFPKDFSANAVPGEEPDAGEVMIYTSQGNNFETAAIAKQFADALKREVNENLNERRWSIVLHSVAGSQRNLANQRGTMDQMRNSARTLHNDAIHTHALAQDAASAAQSLQKTLAPLAADARKWRTANKGSDGVPVDEADISSSIKTSSALAATASTLVDAAHTQVMEVDHVVSGIQQASRNLPGRLDTLEGSAEGLARSVAPVVVIDAPVENSGSGFAANVVPGALWLGAAMVAFATHTKVMPRHARFFASAAQLAGKIFFPSCLVTLQAVLVYLSLLLLLKIHIAHPILLACTLAASSLVFLSIVFTLNKAFGNTGNEIAMVLLAIQLSSSGGIVPVELTSGVFAAISPWLPLTWVVNATKVAMFDAYDGRWQGPMLQALVAACICYALACCVGRWRYVPSTR